MSDASLSLFSLPYPVPGQTSDEYLALSEEIEAVVRQNVQRCLRFGQHEAAEETIDDGLRTLHNIIALAETATSGSRIDLGPAALNPQFIGMASMGSKEAKKRSHGMYQPNSESAGELPSRFGPAADARFRRNELMNLRVQVRRASH